MNNVKKQQPYARLVPGLILSGAMLFTAVPGNAAVQALDQIAIVVNGDPVMRSEINSRMSLMQASSKQQVPDAELEKAAVDELVTERLQIQYAKTAGISIDDTLLDETMQRIAQRNKMNMQTFQAALYRQGINYVQFREQTRNRLLIDRLRAHQTRRQVNISSAEINDLISSQSDQLSAGGRYRLAHSFIPVSQNAAVADINAARQQTYELRRSTLSAGDSADFSNWQGSLNGWQNAAELPTPVRRAVALLESGEISQVTRTAEGFHLFKLLESNKAPEQLAEAERNLRNQATQFLGERKSDDYYRAWLQSLRNSALIERRKQP